MNFVYIYLFLANLLDAVITYIVVSSGRAVELNPLMAYLLDLSPALFFIIKIGLVALSLRLFYITKQFIFSRIALIACAVGYSFVLGIHFVGVCYGY